MTCCRMKPTRGRAPRTTSAWIPRRESLTYSPCDSLHSSIWSRQSPMSDPLWYKDAVIYEAHVRAFFDGNNDGIGDFAGLTEKLDYLQALGINAVWILP